MEKEKKEAGHRFLARLGKKRLRPGGRKATEWLLSHAGLTKDSRVLEVACNMGTTAIDVAGRFGCHITGIDTDDNALEKARENVARANLGDRITLQHANALELPFPDDSFDVVINEAMLTMYPDEAKTRVLQEYARVLKPGGRLLTQDVMLSDNAPDDIITRMRETIHVNTRPLTKNGWETLFGRTFGTVLTSNGSMTLMSPRGMIRDEGFWGALRIFRNALKPENRPMFMAMFRTFRRNRDHINYLASCCTK